MKIIKKKIANRKINWLAVIFLVLIAMILFKCDVTHASIFSWFDDTESQTDFLTNPLYQNYLKNITEIFTVSLDYG